MNLKLTRTKSVLYGVFGELKDENGDLVAVTLEHAYLCPDGSYGPKLPAGMFICVRGEHRLAGRNPFQTFEITNVPGHTGILFHKGNVNSDSEGCVLLGTSFNALGISESQEAFDLFMEFQKDCNQFTLVVF